MELRGNIADERSINLSSGGINSVNVDFASCESLKLGFAFKQLDHFNRERTAFNFTSFTAGYLRSARLMRI